MFFSLTKIAAIQIHQNNLEIQKQPKKFDKKISMSN